MPAAPACKAALAQATARWPARDKSCDGIMGDAAHRARKSDHNDGHAFDLTHDPEHGVDCDKIAAVIVQDKRIDYVIRSRRIWSREHPYWRTYTGSNPHTEHMHVSVLDRYLQDVGPWVGIAIPPVVRVSPLVLGAAVMLATADCHKYSNGSGPVIALAKKGGNVNIVDLSATHAKLEWGGGHGWVPRASVKNR